MFSYQQGFTTGTEQSLVFLVFVGVKLGLVSLCVAPTIQIPELTPGFLSRLAGA